jgi:agmatine deiminase
MKIGLIQQEVSENLKENLESSLRLVHQAAAKGARIICLQELYCAPYFPQDEKVDAAAWAEPIPGPSTQQFAQAAKDLDVVIIVPLFEKAEDGTFYNSAVTIDADGTLLPTYRKVHIPHDPLFWEKNYFAEGNVGFQVHKTKYGNIAALICFDQWFPEAARSNALMGADLLFYPTAIGNIKGHDAAEGDWRDAWTTIQRSHAIANGVHVAAINRVGTERQLQFWGSSFVADAFGNVIAKAGEEEEVLVVDVDLTRNKPIQEEWGFLRNRRPEVYGKITAPLKESVG